MHRWLVLFNLVLGGSALIYDWEALGRLPLWAIPFTVICPLFPLLLAAVWWRWPRPPCWLYWLATLPSAVYGLLALLFYPLVICYAGFDWLTLLQIPWVWLYAGQAWRLLLRPARPLLPGPWPWLASSYLTISLVVQALTGSFGYIGLDQIPHPLTNGLAVLGITLSWLIVLAIQRRTAVTQLSP